jgi:hypothetical protein
MGPRAEIGNRRRYLVGEKIVSRFFFKAYPSLLAMLFFVKICSVKNVAIVWAENYRNSKGLNNVSTRYIFHNFCNIFWPWMSTEWWLSGVSPVFPRFLYSLSLASTRSLTGRPLVFSFSFTIFSLLLQSLLGLSAISDLISTIFLHISFSSVSPQSSHKLSGTFDFSLSGYSLASSLCILKVSPWSLLRSSIVPALKRILKVTLTSKNSETNLLNKY